MPDHVILTPATHARTRVRRDRGAQMGDALMCCLLVPNEFRRAQHDYLILFRRDIAADRTVALALLGFEAGENLYLSDGGWDARYLPLAIDVQPFLIGRFAENEAGGQVHVDQGSSRLSEIDMTAFFTGLHAANRVELGERASRASIWIDTRSRVAAHNDVPDNLACVAVGRRRFTLFPPDQFRDLYLGPIDNTPAGRAVSMVDFHAPDFAAHPRFRTALGHALVAELAAGDALYIPGLWWHHVEGLDPFNVLVNYWWRETPSWLGQPQDALHHAILALRDLPAAQRAHWRAMFDHYVFAENPDTVAHIPAAARGILSPLTAESAGRLRAALLRALGR